MINKKLVLILISLIIILAGVLRIYQLGNVPPSPDWDEVALGYDAYSIIHTGKDEFGKFLPVVLRSFDDYKPALYAYFIIPAIFMFDLTTFAVRFPSAVFGIVSVLAVFLLIREIFEK
ncbi:MAG: 4-amino-4-deoxy-L-arabinose transferase, partial [Patescibacteria group bacterium]